MTKIIELTTRPYGYPIAFEITSIKIGCSGKDKNDKAIVNGVDVAETYRQVVFLAKQNYGY